MKPIVIDMKGIVIKEEMPDFYIVGYEVNKLPNDTWVCSCPAFTYGCGKPCKHIKNVIEYTHELD